MPENADARVEPFQLTTKSLRLRALCSFTPFPLLLPLPRVNSPKMSKKAAKTQTKEQSYDFRDIVLAKVRGYPPWPGMVVDPESVPVNVKHEQPHAAKQKKGNWYCVRFFPAGDYAWIVPKDISKLQQHEIEAYINEPFKRSGDLLQGYRIALDPTKWEAEREALRAEAAEEEANAEIDQLESDGEEEADDMEEKKAKSKKRKRDSDAAPAKPKAKPKPKKESTEPTPKKRAGSAKAKKNGIKSKAMVESEDEGGADADDAGPSKQASPPPTKKAKREKDGEDEVDAALSGDPEAQKVRDWRHKLQKAFLNPKAVPKDEDMPPFDVIFTTVENYENMNIQYLSFSKIGKVMRHIHALPLERVPRDEEFKFRDRAKALVDKWHEILNANKANGTASEGAKAATNGSSPSAKAADAPDVGATTNGKHDSEEPAKAEVTESAMEVDAVVPEAAETGEAEAEGEPETIEDAPAADESMLADVTMSEAA